VWLEKARKDYVGAEAGHRQAVQVGEITARRLCRYAVLLERTQGDNASAAEELYKEAIAMDQRDSKAFFYYGRLLYRQLGRVSEAEAHLRRCLQLESTYTDAMVELAALLHNVKHDVYQAESFYRAALKANPQHASALQGYAALLDDGLKDSRGALAMCERALAVDAEHVPTLCRLFFGVLKFGPFVVMFFGVCVWIVRIPSSNSHSALCMRARANIHVG
jgi:tetratricopeptide (TPR) repeat protein